MVSPCVLEPLWQIIQAGPVQANEKDGSILPPSRHQGTKVKINKKDSRFASCLSDFVANHSILSGLGK
jgi:hypothetical protein